MEVSAAVATAAMSRAITVAASTEQWQSRWRERNVSGSFEADDTEIEIHVQRLAGEAVAAMVASVVELCRGDDEGRLDREGQSRTTAVLL